MPTIVLRLFLLEDLAELVRASEFSPDTTGSLAPILVSRQMSQQTLTLLQPCCNGNPGIDAAVQAT